MTTWMHSFHGKAINFSLTPVGRCSKKTPLWSISYLRKWLLCPSPLFLLCLFMASLKAEPKQPGLLLLVCPSSQSTKCHMDRPIQRFFNMNSFLTRQYFLGYSWNHDIQLSLMLEQLQRRVFMISLSRYMCVLKEVSHRSFSVMINCSYWESYFQNK